MDPLARRFRRLCVVVTHLLLVAIANRLAFELRFDSDVPEWASSVQIQMLPWLLAIRGLLFVPFSVYQGLWRYVGIWDLRNILASVAVSSVVFYLVVKFWFGLPPDLSALDLRPRRAAARVSLRRASTGHADVARTRCPPSLRARTGGRRS